MKKKLLLITLCFNYFGIFSQNITAKLIDKNSKKPVQYATIKTGKYSGVISNEEGYFTINTETVKLEYLTISCLGYKNKTLGVEDIISLQFVIELEEAINQLDEIFISNKKPNADAIIAKVKLKLNDNYDTKANKFNIFHRTTEYMDFKSLDFEIEKASHVNSKNIENANSSLKTLSKKIRESNIIHFTDFKADLYSLDKDNSKLVVHKATKLIDHKNDFSINDIQEKAQGIVLQYLDTTKTYKLKTGIFKVEDSLSLNDAEFKEDNKNEFRISNLNNQTRGLLNHAQFYNNSFLNKFLDFDLYEYALENTTFNNDEITYVISFEPRKGKAKFAGKLYIIDNSYAVTRVNYNYFENRHGAKLNLKLLLGIKYIDNADEGLILFEKDNKNKYHPKYIKRTTGSYFYVNRDLKFIENSIAKNKVGFNFKIEGDNRHKEELLLTLNGTLILQNFDATKQDSLVPFKILNKFEKNLWGNEDTLEPLEEMKAFRVND